MKYFYKGQFVSFFYAALMWAICIFAREDAAVFALSVLKEWSTARYREAVENKVRCLHCLQSIKFDFAYWVVSRTD